MSTAKTDAAAIPGIKFRTMRDSPSGIMPGPQAPEPFPVNMEYPFPGAGAFFPAAKDFCQFSPTRWKMHPDPFHDSTIHESMSQHAEFLPLFLAHQGDLRAFIGALIRDAQTRDDIFQNVALTLWESFDRYERERSFGAWARGIAARKVLHEHRSNARFPLIFPPEAIQTVLDAYDRTEVPEGPRRIALRECMDRLPERTREILTLRYDQDLSGDSIAVRLGSSVDAIHQTLSRTRTALADCIRRRLALRVVEKS